MDLTDLLAPQPDSMEKGDVGVLLLPVVCKALYLSKVRYINVVGQAPSAYNVYCVPAVLVCCVAGVPLVCSASSSCTAA